ncbi:MAG TPA: tRNA pseudouridine(13) synthase TruD [Kofleriaceae bacterium]|nr:tRNA pseudouridine(13) synthase TruD [Kofleriaceae bacterium]
MSLPYLTSELPGIGGVLRATDEDFVVDEEPAYPPSGTGDHVFVRIEKRGLTTPAAVRAIAGALGVQDRDVGVAGMKDRHAVTTQWLSLPPPVSPEAARALELPGVRILEATRHPHKLRTGHVRANRFRLRVRGLPAGAAPELAARARAILERLAAPPGAPNWYGEQRFGKGGDNAARGRELVTGTRRPGRDRRMDRLMVSALQSELFNAWLVARVTDGLYGRVLAGDVLHKRGGGLFDCTDPDVDAPRLLAGEVVVTGPMFGDRMRRPADGTPAAAREAAILDAAGLAPGAFSQVRALAEGTRRDAAIPLADAAAAAAGDETVEVAFTLPGGAYATAIMREVMKAEPEPPAQDAPAG